MADFMLNATQQMLVEDNMALVHAVIRDKVRGARQIGSFTYEDLYQIGCEGLCKAAYTYVEAEKASFSTYAYRVIYNKILDALRYSTVRTRREVVIDQEVLARSTPDVADSYAYNGNAFDALEKALAGAKKSIQKGAEAMRLRLEGYDTNEICRHLDAKQSTVRTWITRTRQYLKEDPELSALAVAMDLC